MNQSDHGRALEGPWAKAGVVLTFLGLLVALGQCGGSRTTSPSASTTTSRVAVEPNPTTPTAPPRVNTVSDTPAMQDTPDGYVVRHRGSITLALRGERIDLDSPMDDPRWQTDIGEIDYGPVVGSKQRQFVVHTGSSAYLGRAKADYETCSSTTKYAPGGRYLTDTLAEGQYLCVETGEKRYSAIRISNVGSEELTIDVVTYDPPRRSR